MRVPIRLLIVALLLAEIAVFVVVGGAIGVAATLALVLVAMVAGLLLLRRQGVATLMSIREGAAAGRLPARPLFKGAALAFAALLLILPGFLTDLAGILLFIPAVRAAIWRRLARRVKVGNLRGEARTATGSVVELEPGEYVATPRPESPWRDRGSQA
jgi:UPF0716 protein FxsA